jgi:hypothetical protein
MINPEPKGPGGPACAPDVHWTLLERRGRAADRKWFRAHPGRRVLVRAPAYPGETLPGMSPRAAFPFVGVILIGGGERFRLPLSSEQARMSEGALYDLLFAFAVRKLMDRDG